jgi:flagellar biosynthesis component FlhA
MILGKLTSPRVRQYLYSLATALLAVAVGYGLISPDQVPQLLTAVAALFAITATSTAAAVTKVQRDNGTL